MRYGFTISVLLLLVAGCGRSSEPDTDKKDNQKFLRCAEPHDDGGKEEFRLPPLTVIRNGYEVQVQGIKRGLIVLGLIAGISEPTPRNMKNLDYLLSQFKEAGAQAIAVAGDVGLEEAHVDAILSGLAKAPVPVLVTPGAQESFDVFRRVIAKKRKTHPQLLDMSLVRRVRIGHITLVSIPGYHKPFYLAAGERGCAYVPKDLELTAALLDEKGPNVILSPSPPRGVGVHAVDRGRGGINIGDIELRRMLTEHNIPFGLFGHVIESGGNTTLADGRTPVQAGIWNESLFIQAGASEALPVTLVGKGRSAGMAQIVEISSARARYQTVFVPPSDR